MQDPVSKNIKPVVYRKWNPNHTAGELGTANIKPNKMKF